LAPPWGGFSNGSFLAAFAYRRRGVAPAEPLVARLPPGDSAVSREYAPARQCRVMQCLADTGVPVPRVRWLEEDEDVLGCKFFVMDRIAGEIPPDIPSYQAAGVFADSPQPERAAMWWRGLETLACIHAVH